MKQQQQQKILKATYGLFYGRAVTPLMQITFNLFIYPRLRTIIYQLIFITIQYFGRS